MENVNGESWKDSGEFQPRGKAVEKANTVQNGNVKLCNCLLEAEPQQPITRYIDLEYIDLENTPSYTDFTKYQVREYFDKLEKQTGEIRGKLKL